MSIDCEFNRPNDIDGVRVVGRTWAPVMKTTTAQTTVMMTTMTTTTMMMTKWPNPLLVDDGAASLVVEGSDGCGLVCSLSIARR